MVRSILNGFEKVLDAFQGNADRREAVQLARRYFTSVRTHPEARIPETISAAGTLPIDRPRGRKLFGTIVTGEMFAPILSEQIERLNMLRGTKLSVLAVPNTYFGGDVAVAGLLTGQDIIAARDKVVGDFLVIPSHIIKSDEPLLLDGMQFSELCAQVDIPVWPVDTNGLLRLLEGEPIDQLSHSYEWQKNPRNQSAMRNPAAG